MGGRSQGTFSINDDGHAVFSGYVSLDNDGGFSSVQHYFDPIDISRYRSAYLQYDADFKAAERYARSHNLNIWGDPELTKKYLRLKSKWGQRQ
jgi:hypothetical protein